jgi:hypothetical protein
MDAPGLFLYLFFLIVFVAAQTIMRRRRAALQTAKQAKKDTLTQTATVKRHEKRTPPAGFRSIESREARESRHDAAPTWTTQPSAIKKSIYRAQFKNHRSVRHAVVSMVVLGPCRAKEPMTF